MDRDETDGQETEGEDETQREKQEQKAGDISSKLKLKTK